MVKLTADLILQSQQHINPCRDYELVLRGYKIPLIENLGAALDQFDSIDLSDNDIRKLDGFPLMNRLKALLLSNNRICRIAEGLEQNIPKLETIIMTNNQMQELGDLDPLASLEYLTTLSLMRNPVAMKRHYRLYVIHKIPQLRILDFRRIKQKERDLASKMFKSKRGQEMAKELVKKSTTFVPGSLPESERQVAPSRPTAADTEAIKRAIAEATSLEEVERLQTLLRAGQVPSKQAPRRPAATNGVEEMED